MGRCGRGQREDLLDLDAQPSRRQLPRDDLEHLAAGRDQDHLAANAAASQFALVKRLNQADQDTARLEHAVGARERVAADRVEHDVDIAHHLLERLRGVVHELVRAEAEQELLPAGRSGGDHMRAACLCELQGDVAHATRRAVD